VAGSCEHGNELLGSIIGDEFLGVAKLLTPSQIGLCSMELVNY
jgi:hypothetical protein